jgi:hypothetical protein
MRAARDDWKKYREPMMRLVPDRLVFIDVPIWQGVNARGS